MQKIYKSPRTHTHPWSNKYGRNISETFHCEPRIINATINPPPSTKPLQRRECMGRGGGVTVMNDDETGEVVMTKAGAQVALAEGQW